MTCSNKKKGRKKEKKKDKNKKKDKKRGWGKKRNGEIEKEIYEKIKKE